VVSARSLGVEYFIKAISTGEQSAVVRLEPFLAEDVEYDPNARPGTDLADHDVFRGKSAVLARVAGQWPETYGYARQGWSEPFAEGENLKVVTSRAIAVTFEFDTADKIRRVALEAGVGSAPPVGGEVVEIPLSVKGVINAARSNDTPMVVTYVDAEGAPHSSYRGSATVITPTEVSLWVREADSGLVPAVEQNPRVSLFYGELPRAIISMSGTARIATDDETRRRAYELPIESEQNHDTERNGVAVVIEIKTMVAFVDRVRYSITP